MSHTIVLRPVLAAVLGAASLAMLVHFVANPLYDDWVDVGAVWDAFSYVLAVGYLLALGVTHRLKAESEASKSGSAQSILLTIAFYATVFLTIVFFRNWTSSLMHLEADEATRRVWWVAIDALFIVIPGCLAIRLWRNHA